MSETVVNDASSPDVIIVGSGMGGATLAAGLAPTGARILILERGEQLQDTPETRDARAIFQRGSYRPNETWTDGSGSAVQSRQLLLCRRQLQVLWRRADPLPRQDFAPIAHAEGRRRAGRSTTTSWSPGTPTPRASIGCAARSATTRPSRAHSAPYPFPAIPDEPAIAAVRERLRRIGLHPVRCRSASTSSAWLKRAPTPWDAFPDTRTGKMDAETCGLAAALAHPNVTLQTGAKVQRLIMAPDGRRVEGVECDIGGERRTLRARLIVLSAGAVNSAALLLRSSERGVANRSDKVGRHFMNHNSSAVLAIDPRTVNDSIYQKTFGLNDFYLDDGARRAAARQYPAARPGQRSDPQVQSASSPRIRA